MSSIRCFAAIVLVALAASLAKSAAPATTASIPAEKISDEALTEFAKHLEAGIARRDPASFDDVMDIDALGKIVTSGIAAGPGFAGGFITGLKGRSGQSYGRDIIRGTSDGGTYRFLRLVTEEGRSLPLFRMQGPSGLNYHKLYIARRATDGKLAISDFHVAISGETFSQTLRRMYMPLAIDSAGEKRSPEAVELLRSLEMTAAMNKARVEGRHADALRTYADIPAKHRQQKPVQLLRMMAAMHTGDEEYKQALAEAAPLFKDDVAADLLSIDALLYQNKHSDAIAAVDRIDKRIGGDPFLDVMRGTITMTAGKPAEAKAFAQSALKREPGLYAASDLLLSLAVQQKDHAETARLLTVFEKEHGLDFGDLNAAEGYEAFVQSPEYKQWLKRPRPKR